MPNWNELESFMTDGMAAQGRWIHIHTGTAGLEMINHCYAVENSVGFVEWMEEKKKVEPDVAKNLISMLRSTDIDNFNMAIMAIELLKNDSI